jgi:hypothetical protein
LGVHHWRCQIDHDDGGLRQPATRNRNHHRDRKIPKRGDHRQLTSPRVQCSYYPQDDQVSVTALATIGGKPQLIITSVYWMGISAAADSGFYTNADPATGTATATKGHWNGEVTYAASGNKLHIVGDATRGSSTAT